MNSAAEDLTNEVGTGTYSSFEQMGVCPSCRRKEAGACKEPFHSQDGSYDTSADMFSLGVVFFEMWQPFSSLHERGSAIKKLREGGAVPPTCSSFFPTAKDKDKVAKERDKVRKLVEALVRYAAERVGRSVHVS